jgi:hypothetical protein
MEHKERILPVIIHHETGEKPQTGGGKNQEYLKYCIRKAEGFNEKVVLLGDDYNRKWCREWIHVNGLDNEKWHHFLRVFENMSTYPDAWAQGIFKRFYLIEEYLRTNNYTECIIMDSDVLVYLDFLKYEPFLHCKAALEIPADQDMSGIKAPNGLKMCAIAGVAYFTLEALSDFNDYCIDIYENHRDILQPKYDAHLTYGLAGGICEMTLLYLWAKSQPQGSVLNLMEEHEGHVFNGPIATEENLLPHEFAVSRITMVKKFRFQNGQPFFIRKDDGKLVATYSFHFGGADKIYLKSVCLHNRIGMTALAERWYWVLRGRLRFLKKFMFWR